MKEKLRLAALDAWDLLTGRRQPMQPSRLRAHAVGVGEFRPVAEHLAQLAIGAGELQPHESVLDVGCGIGRLAVPLTSYLTTGRYAGFDVSRPAIEWCQREITSRHPNFTFTHVDVFNAHYNRRGTIAPADFVFPYADESFDLVFLSSILTHLLPETAARYVSETSRVMKRDGRAVMTFFLLDEDVQRKMRDGTTDKVFHPVREPWWGTENPDDIEAGVAYDMNAVIEALRARNLQPRRISRGSWSVNPDPLTYQDLLIVEKISRGTG